MLEIDHGVVVVGQITDALDRHSCVSISQIPVDIKINMTDYKWQRNRTSHTCTTWLYQTERQTGRQTERRTDRQTDRPGCPVAGPAGIVPLSHTHSGSPNSTPFVFPSLSASRSQIAVQFWPLLKNIWKESNTLYESVVKESFPKHLNKMIVSRHVPYNSFHYMTFICHFFHYALVNKAFFSFCNVWNE